MIDPALEPTYVEISMGSGTWMFDPALEASPPKKRKPCSWRASATPKWKAPALVAPPLHTKAIFFLGPIWILGRLLDPERRSSIPLRILESYPRGNTLESTMGEWLSLMEFATKNSVSLSTLRRQIKSGRVEHKLEDGRYLLWDSGTPLTSSTHLGDSRILELESKLKKAREEIVELKTLLAFYEEQSQDQPLSV